jgi:hypothetical protein
MTEGPRRAARWAVFAAAAAICAGCSSIFTRGLVDDGHGNPVGGATVRVYDESGATPLSLDVTNANGCFLISTRASKGERRYMLDVQASGFQTARQSFALADDVLIADLAVSSSPQPSRIHVATSSERSDRWIPNCAPPNAMGSDALTPN